MNHKGIYAIVTALAIVLLGAWWFGFFGERKDPVVAELEQMRDEGLARREEMSEEMQRASREEFRERMEQITPEQRQAFFESSMPFFMKMMEQRLDDFFALTPEEQRKRMDERIDAMQDGGGPPQGQFRGNGQGPDPGQFDAMRKRWLDMTTPDQRAKMEKAMDMFNQRIKERGMEPMPGGGFF